MRDLEEIFRRHPDCPPMREAARTYRRAWAKARVCGAPLTGSYYWVPRPRPAGEIVWSVQEFFDCWRPSSDHVYVWQHVRDSLELRWGRSFPDIDYRSLPRGRVICRVGSGENFGKTELVIYHGDDSPLGRRGLALVRRAFQLPHNTPAVFDEHEQTILDLGLNGVKLSETTQTVSIAESSRCKSLVLGGQHNVH